MPGFLNYGKYSKLDHSSSGSVNEMASNYGPAFCTSPPPLDAENADDFDVDDLEVGFGRLRSMTGNLDEDDDVCGASDRWPFPSGFISDSAQTELADNVHVRPPEDVNRGEDDFSSFEGHEVKPDIQTTDDCIATLDNEFVDEQDSDICVASQSDDVLQVHSRLSIESSDSNEARVEDVSGHGDDDDEPEEQDFDDFTSFQTSNNTDSNNFDARSENTFPAPTTVVVEQPTDVRCSSAEEFSDFQDARLASSPPVHRDDEGPVQNSGDENDEQEFGNFATFDDSPCGGAGEDETWGDSTAQVGLGPAADSEDIQFGDFDSAPCDVTEFQKEDVNDDQLDRLISLAFPRPPSPTSPTFESMVQAEPDRDSIWNDLWDFMNTNALTYQWSQSRANRMLLESLHVESRISLPNCGWNSSVPAFASTLTAAPLEPTKASLNGEKLIPPPVAAAEVRTSSTDSTRDATSTTIPPVKFDWNGSGLVNPLDGVDDAFLRVVADDQGLAPSLSGRPSPSPIVQKILRDSSAKEAKRRPPRAALSEEAQRVIASLPDLSFLGARVLMFPIRSQLP